MNSGKIAVALRALADAFEEGAQDTVPVVEPQKRGRGRPVKGEEHPATGVAATAAGSTSPDATTAAATPAAAQTTAPASAVVDDPFASTPVPATPTATLEDVRKALTDLRAASDQAAALKVLKDAGGADNLNGLGADKYGIVVAAVGVQLRIIAAAKPAPVVESDPFGEAPAAAPATKAATLEDVKAAVVAAGKKTAQDTVQAVVMSFGGKAADPASGGVKPSLKALAEKDYAAVIAAIAALPATK